MASAEFLEEALSSDVDEKAVNAIVGTLENQLVTSVPSVSQQNTIVNIISSQFPGLGSGSSSMIPSQKCVADSSTTGVTSSIYSSGTTNPSVSCNNARPSTPSTFTPITLTGGVSSFNENIQVIYTEAQSLSNPSSVTFPAQPLSNGSLGLPPSQCHIISTVVPSDKGVAMQPPLVLKQGSGTGQHPGVATVSTSVAQGPIPGQMPAAPVATPVVPASVGNVAPVTPPPQPPTVTTVKPLDNTKEKCRNFMANLLDLSSKEPPSVERNVRNLIQELIDALVEPEEFCVRLERLLNASPQPCLIGFLKKSLPLLRQSLVNKELVIEGINAPPPHVAFSTLPAPAQPVMPTTNVPMVGTAYNPFPLEEDGATLTPLLPPVLPLAPAPSLVSTAKTINAMSMQPNMQPQKPPQKPGSTIAVLQNIPVHTKINVSKVSGGKSMTVNSKNTFPRAGASSAALSTVLTPGKSLLKEKEKKSQFSSQPYADDKMAGDDDINDVAAMGGVNLAEETQRILGSTEMIGTQIRSCKEEYLVPMSVMQARVKAAAQRHNLEEPSPEVAGLVSHAVHERLKNLVEKLAAIAQHRIDLIVKTDSRYEVTQDVKGQLKFLEELDRVDKKRREDSEREMLLRAAKSRSKTEDPEQAKLKAKAKEMQRAELEELRQREANLTALQAIGPRKKPRLDGPGGSAGDTASNGSSSGPGFVSTGRSQLALRTRLKRINHRDMVFLLEQERDTAHSPMLFRSYLK
ncbi:transcription initiation factor TFIID subunit 4 isoform X9 [Manduca sexta]|uniref:transcription initiation factor TFIID subunit 4 isoform X9 n=1 Tax=Manduca sexta TaxID=7130 RepID=UPI001181DF3C|nr:transcription initiation factor TFIID subunit 4 isoform X9 [Manduca sexta]